MYRVIFTYHNEFGSGEWMSDDEFDNTEAAVNWAREELKRQYEFKSFYPKFLKI